MHELKNREADYLPPYPTYRELEPRLMRLIRAIKIGTYFHGSCFDINIKTHSTGNNYFTAILTKAIDSDNLILLLRARKKSLVINQYRLQPFDIRKLIARISNDIHKSTYHLSHPANE